jgi:hypothetical protein
VLSADHRFLKRDGALVIFLGVWVLSRVFLPCLLVDARKHDERFHDVAMFFAEIFYLQIDRSAIVKQKSFSAARFDCR